MEEAERSLPYFLKAARHRAQDLEIFHQRYWFKSSFKSDISRVADCMIENVIVVKYSSQQLIIV